MARNSATDFLSIKSPTSCVERRMDLMMSALISGLKLQTGYTSTGSSLRLPQLIHTAVDISRPAQRVALTTVLRRLHPRHTQDRR
jgi:hypothetical protein